MKRQRIYIDTSVIGGCFDDEFEVYSKKLFDIFRKGFYVPVVADITLKELTEAPEIVRKQLDVISSTNIEYVQLDEEAGELAKKYIRPIAWILLIGSIVLGMYTGILLSAFNARPFWNSAILGPLFLVSGLSTGAALIILLSKSDYEKKLFSKVDITLIGLELFLITHLFMGFLASTEVHIQAAGLFLGGEYTAVFWVFVVGLGLILPMTI